MYVCPICGDPSGSVGHFDCANCRRSPELIGGFPAFAPELANNSEGFKPEYFSNLARLEASNFWFRARNRLILQVLRRYHSGARRLLEIGCGTGYVLKAIREAFAEAELSGSDVLHEGLRFAAERVPSARLFQMDATRIPFEKEFDVICALDVLEHITADQVVLREIFKALRPGGHVVLTVPQHRFLWSVADEYSLHQRRYSRRDLAEKVRAAGFDLVFITSFMSFLLPAMWLSRRLSARRLEGFEPTAEIRRVAPLLNRLLELPLALERVAIGKGVSFPAGGSLLLIGRRPTAA